MGIQSKFSEKANILLARLSKTDNLEPRSVHAPTAERGAGGYFQGGMYRKRSPSVPCTSGEGGDFIPGRYDL